MNRNPRQRKAFLLSHLILLAMANRGQPGGFWGFFSHHQSKIAIFLAALNPTLVLDSWERLNDALRRKKELRAQENEADPDSDQDTIEIPRATEVLLTVPAVAVLIRYAMSLSAPVLGELLDQTQRLAQKMDGRIALASAPLFVALFMMLIYQLYRQDKRELAKRRTERPGN